MVTHSRRVRARSVETRIPEFEAVGKALRQAPDLDLRSPRGQEAPTLLSPNSSCEHPSLPFSEPSPDSSWPTPEGGVW